MPAKERKSAKAVITMLINKVIFIPDEFTQQHGETLLKAYRIICREMGWHDLVYRIDYNSIDCPLDDDQANQGGNNNVEKER